MTLRSVRAQAFGSKVKCSAILENQNPRNPRNPGIRSVIFIFYPNNRATRLVSDPSRYPSSNRRLLKIHGVRYVNYRFPILSARVSRNADRKSDRSKSQNCDCVLRIKVAADYRPANVRPCGLHVALIRKLYF